MDTTEIDKLIELNRSGLERLQPTLHPLSGSLPYSKIGLLNLARKKSVKYQKNIAVLYALKNVADSRELTEEQYQAVVALLENV